MERHIEKLITDMPEQEGYATCIYCGKRVLTGVDDPDEMNITVCSDCNRDVISNCYPFIGEVRK